MTSNSQKRLISLNEACIRYGICRATLYRMADRQQIKLIKIGRASRLDVHQMDALLGIANSPSV